MRWKLAIRMTSAAIEGLMAALVASCATVPLPEAPKIDRLTGAALEAKVPPPAAKITLEDILAMTRKGESAAHIVARIDETHSRYRLDASQIVDLAREGVDLKVLDHITETERQGIFDDMAAEISTHDRACIDRIDEEVRLCRLQSMPPFWPAQPFATCWPPHTGLPYWRCF
jgi:hypothetical protein